MVHDCQSVSVATFSLNGTNTEIVSVDRYRSSLSISNISATPVIAGPVIQENAIDFVVIAANSIVNLTVEDYGKLIQFAWEARSADSSSDIVVSEINYPVSGSSDKAISEINGGGVTPGKNCNDAALIVPGITYGPFAIASETHWFKANYVGGGDIHLIVSVTSGSPGISDEMAIVEDCFEPPIALNNVPGCITGTLVGNEAIFYIISEEVIGYEYTILTDTGLCP